MIEPISATALVRFSCNFLAVCNPAALLVTSVALLILQASPSSAASITISLSERKTLTPSYPLTPTETLYPRSPPKTSSQSQTVYSSSRPLTLSRSRPISLSQTLSHSSSFSTLRSRKLTPSQTSSLSQSFYSHMPPRTLSQSVTPLPSSKKKKKGLSPLEAVLIASGVGGTGLLTGTIYANKTAISKALEGFSNQSSGDYEELK